MPCAGEMLGPDEICPDQLPVNGAKGIFDEKTVEEEVAEEVAEEEDEEMDVRGAASSPQSASSSTAMSLPLVSLYGTLRFLQ